MNMGPSRPRHIDHTTSYKSSDVGSNCPGPAPLKPGCQEQAGPRPRLHGWGNVSRGPRLTWATCNGVKTEGKCGFAFDHT